ncbi:ATP-binding protein [Priestia endophytica]|uniref:ATP-binding protein n=1 Tax=Priestia endophytica TaxID=135735 RepID=UPI001559345B|nr:ATP-binding protein [Priestia endophytica]
MEEVLHDLRQKVNERQANSINQLQSETTSTSTSETSYECSICKDTGFVWEKVKTGLFYKNVEQVVEQARRCECYKRKNIMRLFRNSHITEEFRKLGFNNFTIEGKPAPIQDAFKKAVLYFKSFHRLREDRTNSIALLGNPGTGKTHLLSAVANNLMKSQIPVLYFPYREGFDELKDRLEDLESKVERMKDIDVLFIDDLFKRSATEFEIKTLYSVINYRYLNHKPILISSECLVDDLLDIDEALGSRIYQMCKQYLVEIVGDRRQLNHRLA